MATTINKGGTNRKKICWVRYRGLKLKSKTGSGQGLTKIF